MAEEAKKETIEVDADFVKAVADEVKGEITDSVKETVENSLKGISEMVKETLETSTEKTIKKNIGEGDGVEETEEVEQTEEAKKEAKEIRFMKASVALANGNSDVVRAYNKQANEARAKAGYGNVGTDADGAYLVPDPDFEMEVERLEAEYGVAFQYCDVRRINGNSVKLNKKSSGFELTETAEAGAITGKKLSVGQVTADLRKFTGIAPATDELDEDSAVDYWAEVTKEFAYARAKKADQLVFTDATSGILETSGVRAHTVGSAITDLNWDDLMDAQAKVVAMARKNANWYMNYEIWNTLSQKKDNESRYLFSPNPDNMTTPWGKKVVDTEILPAVGELFTNTAFAVFGDLSRMKLYIKNGMKFTFLKEGTVTDADGGSVNLATQDAMALRGTIRMLAVTRFPEAFCIVGLGTVS